MILRVLSGPTVPWLGGRPAVQKQSLCSTPITGASPFAAQHSAARLTQISAPVADPSDNSKMHRPALPPPKVFVVDDDDAVRDSIKVLLEVQGIEVEDYGSSGELA